VGAAQSATFATSGWGAKPRSNAMTVDCARISNAERWRHGIADFERYLRLSKKTYRRYLLGVRRTRPSHLYLFHVETLRDDYDLFTTY